MDFDILCPSCGSDAINFVDLDITYDDAYQSCECAMCRCRFAYTGNVTISWDSHPAIESLPPTAKSEE